jgi:hypothetical protein
MADFEYTIAPFDQSKPPPPKDLAYLHEKLLPTSPASLLGRPFLERFYYAVLPRDNHIFGVLTYIDSKPVGFWVGTQDSNGFMRKALKRHVAKVGAAVVSAIVSNPARLVTVMDVLWLIRSRKAPEAIIGESLSHGVLAPYRLSEFKSKTGVFIAEDQQSTGLAEFCRRGTKQIRSIVDQSNERYQEFMMRRGMKLYDPDVAGWRVPSVELRIAPEDLIVE